MNQQPDTEKKNRKKNQRSLFRSAVRLYAALAIVALVATFGWFTVNTFVSVQNETPGNIQITVNAGDLWIATSLDDFESEDYADRAQMLEINRESSSYIDISGNGETLYYPKSLEITADNQDVVDLASADNFSDVTGNEDFYVELRVYFRTSAQMDVYLSKNSAIEGLQKGLTNVDNVNAFSRTSLFGNFNCDAIIGAARVAFLESDMDEENETLTLKNVWIPNDDIMLSYTDAERVVAKLETGVAENKRESRNGGYHYLVKKNNIMEEMGYSVDDYATGAVTVTTRTNPEAILANPDTKMSNQAVPLLSFDSPGKTQTKLMVIRIWFEGTDREADKALNGGIATYNLDFIGLSKDETKIPLATEAEIEGGSVPEGYKGIYYNAAAENLCYYDPATYNQSDAVAVTEDNRYLYSLNGIDWFSFTSTTNEILAPMRSSGAYTIYFRTAETKTEKPGNVVTVTVPARS